MTVNYKGISEDFNYRIAEINFKEEELAKVEYIAKVMNIKGYDIEVVTDGYAICEVDGKEEYKEFMKEWKEVKKSVALWKKFNKAY